ncbi:hypothetical protein [Halorussus litoreus]|uniref:hypothetical protein n=1 Tax=Halorussus litoreus TaxID=1710536 RepID=UPI0013007EC5|nr:hypothetical protein [Halorussus litoreus]
MKRTLLIAVVVAGLAACGALSSAATLTPAAASTDSAESAISPPQANETAFPPGVNESGVTGPLALATAHRETLGNTSYAAVTTITFQRPNGTVVAEATTITRVESGGESFSVATTGSQSNASAPLGVDHYRSERWVNETTVVVADTLRSEEPTYRQVNRENSLTGPDANWELLYGAFGTGETIYVGQVERGGTTLHKIVSTPSRTEATDGPVDGTTYDFSALVDSEGVVHNFQTTQRSTLEGETVVVTRTMRITEIGNTTVERPDWYEQAVENDTETASE